MLIQDNIMSDFSSSVEVVTVDNNYFYGIH